MRADLGAVKREVIERGSAAGSSIMKLHAQRRPERPSPRAVEVAGDRLNNEEFRLRIGLARIPLYIPPFIVAPAQENLYQELDARMNAAIFERRDLAEHARLKAEQKALMRFRPWMKHSFTDPTPPVPFHPQVLADFATVEEMCQKVLTELH